MSTTQFVQDFDSLSNYLRGFAMNLAKDKTMADDLFQETALNAFRHKDKFRKDTNMKAWLSTIMKNSFINQYRKRQRRSKIYQRATVREGYSSSLSGKSIHNEGEVNISVEEITKLIDRLDENFRIPFLMTYQGYKYEEIQAAMGDAPMGTIKSRIHQARKILKKQIEEMYQETAIQQ